MTEASASVGLATALHSNISFFDLRTVKEPSSETLLRRAELVLTLDCFHSLTIIVNKSMVWQWVATWRLCRHQFSSSTKDELNQFITAVNSFHPALKYTLEISDTFLAFLDIKVSIKGNGLCTSVHYKPTDSHSYLLYSPSHPSHVENSIHYVLILSFLESSYL